MKIIVSISLLILGILVPSIADSQTNLRFAWSQSGSSLAAVQAYTYKIYVGNTPTILTNVVCTGTAAPFNCTAPIIPFPQGVSNLTLTSTAGLLESPRSGNFQIDVPFAPVGLSLTNN